MERNFQFSIAGVPIKIIHDQIFDVTDSFLPFVCKEDMNGWEIFYRTVKILPKAHGTTLYVSEDYKVFGEENGIVFHYIDRDTHAEYAISRIDYLGRFVEIQYLPDSRKYFGQTNNCLFHSQWERIMIEEGRTLFHASCIATQYGGILFSGCSGVGKSTQSELWIQKEGAKLINGDRPILSKEDGRWYAYGSPYAGSSKCHINECVPVRCIVMLSQGKRNVLRRLSLGDAFRNVYKNLTVNTWDKVFVSKVLEFISDLIEEIPVYEYSCLPEFSAVEELKNELERSGK